MANYWRVPVLFSKSPCLFIAKRSLLSSSYACSDAWDSRNSSKILKEFDPFDFTNEVKRKFLVGQYASAIDVDIAVNLADYETIEEIKPLLYKLRHCSETAKTLASTHHAVVRAFLKYGKEDELLGVLCDTINYGIFPDCYASNLLIEYFLQKKDFKNAAKIGCLAMLQEDFDNSILCYLSVYSSLLYLQNVTDFDNSWDSSLRSAEGEDIYLRIPYLKNPYDDEHFDLLSRPKKLLGKNLAWTSQYLSTDSRAAPSLEFLGHALLEDFERAFSVANNANILFSEAVELAKTHCATAVATTSDTEAGDISKKFDADELNTLFDNLLQKDFVVKENLEQCCLEEVQGSLTEFERKDMKAMKKLFSEWNALRESKMQEQVSRLLKRERLRIINEQRKELESEDQLLHFYEHKDEYEKIIETKFKEIQVAKKVAVKEGEVPPDESYIVPEIMWNPESAISKNLPKGTMPVGYKKKK